MRENPNLEAETIAACLERQFGVYAASLSYLPIGYDLNAFVYKAHARDGSAFFLKVRSGPAPDAALLVPKALVEHGIRNILSPLTTRNSDLWSPIDGSPGYSLVVYPFIEGESAMVAGLSDEQWREFGTTLNAVHKSGLGELFRGRVPVETFALPSAALVRTLLDLPVEARVEGDVASRFGEFWREHSDVIRRILARAEALGAMLQSRLFELVLCHADIHAANILVGDDGRIWLVDWDGPLIAPRERDLLFVIGSKIARTVQPREEDLFFETYGSTEIDLDALIYYRYERIIEDIGVMGMRVLLDPRVSEQARAEEAELAMSFFAPGGDIESADFVSRPR